MRRWDLVIARPGELAARDALDVTGTHYVLCHLDDDKDVRFNYRNGIPAYWKWCDRDHQCITLYDSGLCKLQHFNNLSEQFRRELDGKHWRAPQTPYRNPLKAPGAGNAGIPSGRTLYSIARHAFAGVDTGEPERTIEDAGIRAGEIIGRRAWLLDDKGLLHSVYMHRTVWHPGEIMIGDDPDQIVRDYDGSSTHCAGIHAFKNDTISIMCLPEYIRFWRQRFVEPSDPYAADHPYRGNPFVIGKIAMWGKVIEHEFGYRAQYAAIHSIADPDVAKRYNVPTTNESKDLWDGF